ncbi:myb-like protein X [Vigna unguiculata]|uniref:myb-like protein X n=1 Tax=Vigna unguiculata TaxID=3917 RepID=UPI0010168DB0|nr:myb-like protein X [Vigna unguiculata]XP_027919212.1 myb-like protein X [Vigna unguiculata]
MSRCFPFPPPGYLKKTITDEVGLLKKEKQKERKHKKDKKDKEKRESKEKRDKEGRDGKHKEKKDKKEKHREKKKDKDKDKNKDRDKSKISTADDKGFPRQAEVLNGNLHQKAIKQDDKKDIMFENRLTKQCTGSNGEKAGEKNHLVEDNQTSKFLLELNRRIRDDNGGADNQFVHKSTNTDNRKDEETFRLVAKAGGTFSDGNEKLVDKGLDVKKIDGREIQPEVRPTGNTPVPNHAGNFHPRVDGIPKHLGKPFERNLEATVEGNERVKEKKDKDEDKEMARRKTKEGKVKERKDEGNEKVKDKKDDKRRDKRKDKEKEKKGHGKNKDRDKEKKKEEKAREHSEHKTADQNKSKESNKIGVNDFAQLSRNSLEVPVRGENLKKRKDIESNGVPRVDDSFPNKFPKLSSSHSFTDNGRILISTPDSSYRPQEDNCVKVENKECKINGVIEAKPFSASSKKTHTAIVSTDLLTEAHLKPPHPDTKYLDQLYSVPKVDHWTDFDEEWLFGGNLPERKSMIKCSDVGDTPQVWAEALLIEQADAFALPYVIPY